MKRIALLLGLGCLSTTVAAGILDAEVEILNNSSWDIHELYLSSTDDEEWGPDQLGKHVLDADGGKFTLSDIDCDDYDVKIVDEDGDECVIGDVSLCVDNETWEITDADLLTCQALTE